MLSCFVNYVGIKSLCSGGITPLPPSGYFIDMMPGINGLVLDYVAEGADYSGADLWQNLQARALMNFESEIMKYLNHRVKVTQGKGIVRFGVRDGVDTIVPFTPQLQGIRIKVCGGEYKSVRLHELRVFSASSALNVPFLIYDMQSGSAIASFTFDISAGENVLQFDYFLPAYSGDSQYFICYDSSLFSAIDTTNDYVECSGNRFLTPSCGDDFCGDDIWGAYSTSPNPNINNTILSGSTYGLSAKFIYECSLEQFICENRARFLDAWLDCLALEVWLQRKYSARMNKMTSMNEDKIADAIKQYSESMAEKINRALLNISIPCNECFTPNSRVGVRNSVY